MDRLDGNVRLKLPDRIPLLFTLIALVVLFVVQQIQHTSLAFSLLFCAFVLLGNVGFNLAGGFTRAAGAYVFFFTLLTCTIGVVMKAFVGEAADSNLHGPLLDMSAYLCAMMGLIAVVLLINRLRANQQSFAAIVASGRLDYTLSGIGCFVAMVVLQVLNATIGSTPGDLLSAINQLNIFPSLAILLTTVGAVEDSNGRRTFNLPSFLAIAVVAFFGTLSFSKQAMLTPLACWLLAIAYTRFRLRLTHLFGLALVGWYCLSVVPLIAGGRDAINEDNNSLSGHVAVVYQIVTHLGEAREEALATDQIARVNATNTAYYNVPLGFLERFTILPVDDAFFDYTARGNTIGLRPVREYFINLVPHFLLPSKPNPVNGNFYAHEIGGFLAPDDLSTGISFSPVAEAFHVAGWYGLLLLLPGIWLLLLLGVDWVVGDLRRSPWGLVVAVGFAHSAAESLLGGLVYGAAYGNLTLILAIYFCTRFTPVLGALFAGQRHAAQIPQPVPRATSPGLNSMR